MLKLCTADVPVVTVLILILQPVMCWVITSWSMNTLDSTASQQHHKKRGGFTVGFLQIGMSTRERESCICDAFILQLNTLESALGLIYLLFYCVHQASRPLLHVQRLTDVQIINPSTYWHDEQMMEFLIPLSKWISALSDPLGLFFLFKMSSEGG